MTEKIINTYCHSCGKSHQMTQEQLDRHRDGLRAAEAARIDAARKDKS